MNLLVTGFGPFLTVRENPSQWLAENCGGPYRVLEVSFAEVDEFLASGESDQFDAILHLGVASNADKMHWETVGRNWVCDIPDTSGDVRGPLPIEPSKEHQLSTTLYADSWLLEHASIVETSVNAQAYLCNYLLYRSLQCNPGKGVGFLHVVPFEAISQESQLRALLSLCEALRSDQPTNFFA